jgi:hypothetical protein
VASTRVRVQERWRDRLTIGVPLPRVRAAQQAGDVSARVTTHIPRQLAMVRDILVRIAMGCYVPFQMLNPPSTTIASPLTYPA